MCPVRPRKIDKIFSCILIGWQAKNVRIDARSGLILSDLLIRLAYRSVLSICPFPLPKCKGRPCARPDMCNAFSLAAFRVVGTALRLRIASRFQLS